MAQTSKEPACDVGDPGSVSGLGNPLEEERATHSGNLAWKMPCTEEPCGLQSMRSQGVGHD